MLFPVHFFSGIDTNFENKFLNWIENRVKECFICKTLAIYFPTGTKIIEMIKILMTPNNSVFIKK
jgi:hypothetical protein